MAPPSHYVEIFDLLDGGLRDGGWMGEGRPKGGHALAILPGLTHYNLFSSPLFAAVTLAFLATKQSQLIVRTGTLCNVKGLADDEYPARMSRRAGRCVVH